MLHKLTMFWTAQTNVASYKPLLWGEVLPDIEAQDVPGLTWCRFLRRRIQHYSRGPCMQHMVELYFDREEDLDGFLGEGCNPGYMGRYSADIRRRLHCQIHTCTIADNSSIPPQASAGSWFAGSDPANAPQA